MGLSESYLYLFIFLKIFLEFPAVWALTFDKVEVKVEGSQNKSSYYPFRYPDLTLKNYTIKSFGDGRYFSEVNETLVSIDGRESNEMESTSGQRKKRQGQGTGQVEPRTFIDVGIGPGVAVGPAPFCFEREVYGTCRYRTSPEECFRHEWTAYATIINNGYKKVTSLPEGLFVFPGGHSRARVFLKTSCCNPIVEFIATDLFLQSFPCIVDVRELQDLHPGEIAGIVVGGLLLLIIIIVLIALCVRRQQRIKRERETVIFGRSLTASKSRSNSLAPHRDAVPGVHK